MDVDASIILIFIYTKSDFETEKGNLRRFPFSFDTNDLIVRCGLVHDDSNRWCLQLELNRRRLVDWLRWNISF